MKLRKNSTANSKKYYKKRTKLTRKYKGGNTKTKAYVINLDERKDKWEQIQKDFKDTDIEVERFPAVNHERGGVGIGKSFQALIQMAKDKNMDSILIMEDDCKPLKHFNKRWPIIKKWLDENRDKWNIFNGGPITPMEQKMQYDINGKNKIYTSNGASALHFVLFSKESYDMILQWTFDKDFLLDWFINREKNKYIYIDPPLAMQHSGLSNSNSVVKNFTKNDGNQGSYMIRVTKSAENLYE